MKAKFSHGCLGRTRPAPPQYSDVVNVIDSIRNKENAYCLSAKIFSIQFSKTFQFNVHFIKSDLTKKKWKICFGFFKKNLKSNFGRRQLGDSIWFDGDLERALIRKEISLDFHASMAFPKIGQINPFSNQSPTDFNPDTFFSLSIFSKHWKAL
jgi:hypothetical protein